MTTDELLAKWDNLAKQLAGRKHAAYPAVLYEDLLQETRLSLIKSARLYDPTKASFSTYAVKGARRALNNYTRRETHRGFSGWSQEHKPKLPEPLTDITVEQQDSQEDIWSAAKRHLRPTAFAVVESFYRYGKPLSAIEAELGLKPRAATWIKDQAVAQLKTVANMKDNL